MTTMVIRVDLPPRGALETSGEGADPSPLQMAEEYELREEYLAGVSAALAATVRRPPHHSGNVSRVELLGSPEWSRFHHYLILLEVDVGDPLLDVDAIAPQGATLEVVGRYRSIRTWPYVPAADLATGGRFA